MLQLANALYAKWACLPLKKGMVALKRKIADKEELE